MAVNLSKGGGASAPSSGGKFLDVKVKVEVEKGLEVDIEKCFHDAMEEALRRAKMRTPVREGVLRDSLQLTQERDGIQSDAPHFPHIEYGTVHINAYAMVRTSLEEVQGIFDDLVQKELNR